MSRIVLSTFLCVAPQSNIKNDSTVKSLLLSSSEGRRSDTAIPLPRRHSTTTCNPNIGIIRILLYSKGLPDEILL
jgi:hypothetical protein